MTGHSGRHHRRPACRPMLVALLLLFGSGSMAAEEGAASPPALDTFEVGGDYPVPERAPGAVVQLFTGKVLIGVPQSRLAYRAVPGRAVSGDDIIYVTEGATCRLLLPGGDVMDLGGNTLLQARSTAEGGDEVRLWSGRAIAYLLPDLAGRRPELLVRTPHGELRGKAAKLALSSSLDRGRSGLLLFDGMASWTEPGAEARQLSAGQSWESGTGEGRFDPQMERQLSLALSTEPRAVAQALVAYDAGELNAARSAFEEIQRFYPYNAAATYYLGLMALADGDKGEAIRQWQNYAKYDPEGATQNGIPPQLTQLVREQLKEEIKIAMEQEQRLSDAPPEPNSVAVPPFVNKGNKRYEVMAKGITAMVITDLAKVPGLKVLERQKLQRLIDEISLSERGLTSEETSIRAGKLLKAEKLVVGDYQFGEQAR